MEPVPAKSLLEPIARQLHHLGRAEALSVAFALLEALLGLDKAKVLAGHTVPSSQPKLWGAVARIARNEPLQYVLGGCCFFGLRLALNPAVLIPRPETEELVSIVTEDLRGQAGLTVMDACTGSGCVAIALAKHLRHPTVYATDISPQALAVAQENATANGAAVSFFPADLRDTKAWTGFPSFDVLVSNPPYVTASEKNQMHPNVLEHEPHLALFVPDSDPLLFYRALAGLAVLKLAQGGWVFLETNEMYADDTAKLFAAHGFRDVAWLNDLFGKPRFVKARR